MASETVAPLSLLPLQTASGDPRLVSPTPKPTTTKEVRPSAVVVFPIPSPPPASPSEQQTYIVLISVVAGVLFLVVVALLLILRRNKKKRRSTSKSQRTSQLSSPPIPKIDSIETEITPVTPPRTPILKVQTSKIWKDITHQREEGTLHPNASKYTPLKHSKSDSFSSEKQSRKSTGSNYTDDSRGFFVIPQQLQAVEYNGVANISRLSAPVIYVGQVPLLPDCRPPSATLDPNRRNRSFDDITKALRGRTPPPLKRSSSSLSDNPPTIDTEIVDPELGLSVLLEPKDSTETGSDGDSDIDLDSVFKQYRWSEAPSTTAVPS
ncbi:hypothetical protein HK098_004273 [Nowakowskiella sp. JEL0407]|nr:hypothetical protein HK098_004273 [Nowakowskiella sp. JEL0407]